MKSRKKKETAIVREPVTLYGQNPESMILAFMQVPLEAVKKKSVKKKKKKSKPTTNEF